MTTMGLKYEPLDLSSRQIRLLTLLPVSDTLNDPVSATLRIASLDDEPEFDSLSYVWGDEEDTRDIIVNGHTTKVTKNLEAALRRLRESTPRVLWVDALCINQKDIAEKNHQVPFMAQLYTTCQRAIIWLGEGNNRIEELFRWLNSTRFEESADNETSSMTTACKRPSNETAYLGYLDVFELPYWQRMWTYQEMILPVNDPICVYGSHRSPFSVIMEGQTLLDLLKGCDTNSLAIELAKSGLGTVDKFVEHVNGSVKILKNAILRNHKKNSTNIPLGVHLVSSIGRASKDPRDRIYALYGLHPEIQRMYPADYNDHFRPLDRVLIEATVYLVMGDPSFVWLLQQFRMRPNRFFDATLPSWVPDYDVAAGAFLASWVCAKSLQRRSVGYSMPATRKQDTAAMVGIPGVHVRSRQEPVSAAVPADLCMYGEILESMAPEEQKNDSVSFPVEGTEVVLLPGAKHNLDIVAEVASLEGPVGKELHWGVLIQGLLGDKPTLRFAGRYIGTCVNIHTFEADKALNAAILHGRFKKVSPPQGQSSRLGLMLVELMRIYGSKGMGFSTIEDIRAACEVAMSPASSSNNKFVESLKKVFRRNKKRETSYSELDEKEHMTDLFFYNILRDSSSGTINKKLFALSGEPALVGIGGEDIQDGDTLIVPIDKNEWGIPLLLRKVRSSDSITARTREPLHSRQAHRDGDGTVYYKLVGPVIIPALSEETELVSRLAQSPVEDFFIQ